MKGCVLAFLLAAVGLFAGCQTTPTAPQPTPDQIAYGEASVVIKALQRFRRDSGHYPAHLDELKPKYLAAELYNTSDQYILTQAGTCLAYAHINASAYKLTFGLGLPKPQHYLCYRYSSWTGRWTSSEEVTLVLFVTRPAPE